MTGENRRRPHQDWRVWWGALRGVFASMDEQNLGLIAAGVAFYAMLALFPAVAALIALWGFFSDPSIIDAQLSLLEGFVPVEAYNMIDTQVAQVIAANTSTLGWTTAVSMGVALWVSRNGVAALIRGLNTIYRERNRSALRDIFAAFGVTFLLIGVALVALSSVVVVPIMLALLPLGPLAGLALSAARWVVAIGVMILGLSVIYRYGPNRRAARPGWLTPGAIIAVVIWAVASWGFSLYLSNFGRYNEIYGTLGAVVALLMWLYISAYVILLGASLNAELELRTKADTTVGPARPPGHRHAFVADTIVAPTGERAPPVRPGKTEAL